MKHAWGKHPNSRRPSNDITIFDKKTIKLGDCWIWQGYKDRLGYGRVQYKNKKWLAHRLAYTMFVGAVPENKDLDHLCRNPSCVNPQHLEPVSHRTNVLRGASPLARYALLTQCSKGHELSGDNLRIRIRPGNIGRECIQCNKDRLKAWHRAKRLSHVL